MQAIRSGANLPTNCAKKQQKIANNKPDKGFSKHHLWITLQINLTEVAQIKSKKILDTLLHKATKK